MPTLIIPPGYAQCLLRFTVEGDNEEMLTSIGVRLTAGVTSPSDVGEEITDAWLSNFLNSDMSGAYVMRGARVYIGQDGDPVVGEHTVASGGGSGSTVLPNNCAMLIHKVTGLGGRRNRGRMFVPPCYMGETSVDHNGDLDSGLLAARQADADGFFGTIDGSTGNFDAAVIFHSVGATTPTLITALTVASKVATQRERMRR